MGLMRSQRACNPGKLYWVCCPVIIIIFFNRSFLCILFILGHVLSFYLIQLSRQLVRKSSRHFAGNMVHRSFIKLCLGLSTHSGQPGWPLLSSSSQGWLGVVHKPVILPATQSFLGRLFYGLRVYVLLPKFKYCSPNPQRCGDLGDNPK